MKKELSVALLMDDATQARNIASSFRKLGVLPVYYDTLESFWKEIEVDLPDFAVVDVKKMSEGENILINHPMIKNECLPLAFYYDDSTIPLVSSAYEIYNYGLIRKSIAYDGQLKSILNRVNKFQHHIQNGEFLQKKVNALQAKTAKLIGVIHDHREKFDFDLFVSQLVNEIEQKTLTDDFSSACLDVFSNWNEVQALGLYELTGNGQRLVSSSLRKDKLADLPSLWLGQVCKTGIEFFADNMAANVVMDTMGKGDKNIITLRIHGSKKSPEMLLFLKLTEEFIPNFNWSLLEKLLTGINREFLLKRKSASNMGRTNTYNPWEMVGMLDEEFYSLENGKESDHINKQLVSVDFAKLMEAIKDRPKLRFNWSSFYKDFLFHLDRNIDTSYMISHWGTSKLSFVIEQKAFEEFFISLKALAVRFAYWRYFEDSALVLTSDFTPDVRVVPFSSMAYFRYTDSSSELSNSNAISQAALRASSIMEESRPLLDA